jgi:hypothetical protein
MFINNKGTLEYLRRHTGTSDRGSDYTWCCWPSKRHRRGLPRHWRGGGRSGSTSKPWRTQVACMVWYGMVWCDGGETEGQRNQIGGEDDGVDWRLDLFGGQNVNKPRQNSPHRLTTRTTTDLDPSTLRFGSATLLFTLRVDYSCSKESSPTWVRMYFDLHPLYYITATLPRILGTRF